MQSVADSKVSIDWLDIDWLDIDWLDIDWQKFPADAKNGSR
jgi:hypothetical protein